MSAAALATLLMFSCVISGGELVVAGDIELPMGSAELLIP